MAMDGALEFKEERKENYLIIRIKGRLDAVTSTTAEKKIFDFINNGHINVLLDLTAVPYVSSSGMRMLLSTSKKLKTLMGKFVIFGMSPNVLDVLKISGFDHVLELTLTEDEAKARM